MQIISKKKKQNLYINLESIHTINNIDKIIKSKEFNKLKGVVIGRSDLAGSLNLEKSKVDSDKIFKLVIKLLKRLKKKNVYTKMGGSLTPNSVDFVRKLFQKKLLNSVETRNNEVKLNNYVLKNFREIIISIFNFDGHLVCFEKKPTRPSNSWAIDTL